MKKLLVILFLCLSISGCTAWTGDIQLLSLNEKAKANPLISADFIKVKNAKGRNYIMPGDILEIQSSTGETFQAKWPPQSQKIDMSSSEYFDQLKQKGSEYFKPYLLLKGDRTGKMKCISDNRVKLCGLPCTPAPIMLTCTSDKNEDYEIRYIRPSIIPSK